MGPNAPVFSQPCLPLDAGQPFLVFPLGLLADDCLTPQLRRHQSPGVCVCTISWRTAFPPVHSFARSSCYHRPSSARCIMCRVNWCTAATGKSCSCALGPPAFQYNISVASTGMLCFRTPHSTHRITTRSIRKFTLCIIGMLFTAIASCRNITTIPHIISAGLRVTQGCPAGLWTFILSTVQLYFAK